MAVGDDIEVGRPRVDLLVDEFFDSRARELNHHGCGPSSYLALA